MRPGRESLGSLDDQKLDGGFTPGRVDEKYAAMHKGGLFHFKNIGIFILAEKNYPPGNEKTSLPPFRGKSWKNQIASKKYQLLGSGIFGFLIPRRKFSNHVDNSQICFFQIWWFNICET